MAHLLMIESWVGASGNLLPPLLHSMGHTYTFVTRKPAHYQTPLSTERHAVFRYAQNVIETETNDLEQLLAAVGGERFDGVITVCDYYIETVCAVAKALGLPCPFPTAVGEVRQKHRMRQRIDQAGLPNVRYHLAQTWEQVRQAAMDLGYPLVIKPVDLASSAFVQRVDDEDALHRAFAALEEFPLNFRDQPREPIVLLEEFLEGEEVSVESISCQGETTIVGITDKSVTGAPYFIENGHMFPADLTQDQRQTVTEYVRQVLAAVGYDHGIGHTEVKLTRNGPRIVEINPRTPGNYIVELIHRVTGLDLLRAFVQLSLGQKPDFETKETGITSAAILFCVPDRGGKLLGLTGEAKVQTLPHIVRCKFEDCAGKEIDRPIDNACYLAHLVAEDPQGMRARAYAQEAMAEVTVLFAEEEAEVAHDV